MKLLDIIAILSRLDESIDIHGLAKLHKGNPEFDRAVKDYRASLQGRKKDLLTPFGLDDLDKFKENPDAFVKMVVYAVDSFKEKKEQAALYKKVYEDDRCLITMPKGPKGAAAAGSFCKKGNDIICPWCVCIKYPENEKWWKRYKATTLAFVYAKENGVATDACCVLLTALDAVTVIGGTLAYSQVEGIENKGLSNKPEEQRKVLERLYGKTGLTDNHLVKILSQALKPMEAEFRKLAFSGDLIEASEDGDATRVMRCLNAGANVNARNKYDETPLGSAAYYGHLEICKLLLDAGADVKDGVALVQAASGGELDVCKLLIDAGADVNDCMALVGAAGWGHLEICKFLIDMGADVNGISENGCSPLLEAAFRGCLKVCKLLIDAGANVNIANEIGHTPLLKASTRGYLDVCKFLIDAGANVNAADENGFTPLLQAASLGHLDVCKLLIDAGANVNARDMDGDTSLYWAARWGYLDICKLLIDAGADVNARDRDNNTPLSGAQCRGNTEVVELLLAAGARE